MSYLLILAGVLLFYFGLKRKSALSGEKMTDLPMGKVVRYGFSIYIRMIMMAFGIVLALIGVLIVLLF